MFRHTFYYGVIYSPCNLWLQIYQDPDYIELDDVEFTTLAELDSLWPEVHILIIACVCHLIAGRSVDKFDVGYSKQIIVCLCVHLSVMDVIHFQVVLSHLQLHCQ